MDRAGLLARPSSKSFEPTTSPSPVEPVAAEPMPDTPIDRP
jgi:hypothetical protein